MAWCPKCRTEYQEGIEKCADCGSDLVDELPEEEEIVAQDANADAEEGEAVERLVNEDGEELTEEEIEELKEEMRRASEPAKVYVSSRSA